jgi:hypothetical protein
MLIADLGPATALKVVGRQEGLGEVGIAHYRFTDTLGGSL